MDNEPFIDFTGKIILVSGASSGFGRAICIELSRRGAELVLMGRNEQGLSVTSAHLVDNTYHVLQLDLANHAETAAAIRRLSKQIGRIYGLCHSAGVVETRPLAAANVQGLQNMLDVNLISGLEMAKAICRRDVMDETGGSLLYISSIYAHVGVAGQIGYCGSKGAVISAARAMAVELARRNIRVNTISPGLVHTAMTDEALSKLSQEQAKKIEEAHPLGVGKPEDVARAAAFLLAPQNPWITGIDLVVDGGYTAQ
jgi:NAD(P)-dependent dehydrogenase (short-subunit alcohol dehydrogenase family)